MNNNKNNMIKRRPVFEYVRLPEAIGDQLCDYYKGTDHRPILNGDFVRYPYIHNLNDFEPLELDQWFLDHGVTLEDEYILIHFDW